jgi:hypothetical protein
MDICIEQGESDGCGGEEGFESEGAGQGLTFWYVKGKGTVKWILTSIYPLLAA